MKKEVRTVVYDDELRMEAYRFEGIVQPFPSHFHEHYVIGFVEDGERVLFCRDREYAIEKGSIPECRQEIERACEYMTAHFTERIYLDQICGHVGLSKSALLRGFAKEKGVTPYRYLEAVRINEAKKLLSEGVPPVEAAIRTGFSDQSHFTNYFNQFIGLAPGTYREIFSDKDGDGGQHGE